MPITTVGAGVATTVEEVQASAARAAVVNAARSRTPRGSHALMRRL
jgi:hypothetical protein